MDALGLVLPGRRSRAHRLIEADLQVDAIRRGDATDAARAQAHRHLLSCKPTENLKGAFGLLDGPLNGGHRPLAFEEPYIAVLAVERLESGVGQPDIEVDGVVLDCDRHRRFFGNRTEEADELGFWHTLDGRWL